MQKEKDKILLNYLEKDLITVTKIQEALEHLGFTVTGFKRKKRVTKTYVLQLEQELPINN